MMGKRPVNSTKGGKFMNPTDQARKVARKKELKRNKKLRQTVRAAAIKSKDPKMLIMELENLDAIEYDPVNPPHLSETMLKDRRRKLMENFGRILHFYQREDPEKYVDVKETLARYESMRREKQRYYEAVKAAQRVTVETIPLPVSLAPLPSPPILPVPGDGVGSPPAPSGLGPQLALSGLGPRPGSTGSGLRRPVSTGVGLRPASAGVGLRPAFTNLEPRLAAIGRGSRPKTIRTREPFSIQGSRGEPSLRKKGILKERSRDKALSKVKCLPPGPPPGPPPPLMSDGDYDDDDDDKRRAIRAALKREKQLKEAETLVQNALSNGSSARLRIITFSDEIPFPVPRSLPPPSPSTLAVAVAAPNASGARVSSSARAPSLSALSAPPVPPMPLLPRVRFVAPGRPPIVPSLPSSGQPTMVRPPIRQPARAPFPPGLPFGPPPGPPSGPPPAGLRPFAGGALVRQFGSSLDNVDPRQNHTTPPPLQQIREHDTPNLVLSSDPKLIDPHRRSKPQQHPSQLRQQQRAPIENAAALSGGADSKATREESGVTISATPVLRIHVHPDVTRFTPTAVKVKRNKPKESTKKKKKKKENNNNDDDKIGGEKTSEVVAVGVVDPMLKARMTDSAYESFMREIEELM